MKTPTAAPSRRHPPALYWLSLFELFERLAFATVLPLFALYLHEHLGHSEAFAIALSSGFLAATYLASLPGGFLADRFLGRLGAIFLGAILLSIGFAGLASGRTAAFWPALGALLLGQGLVKPSIATLIGSLYPDSAQRREHGFLVFYISINLGSLAGPLLAEWARMRWGWEAIFVCAAVAMVPALMLLLPAVRIIAKPTTPGEKTIVAILPADERSRLRALVLLCCVAVVFWLAFQQTGTSLALFAQDHTVQSLGVLSTRIPLRPGHFAALHAGLVVGLMPALLWVMGRLRARQTEPSTPEKMVWGYLMTAAAFAIVTAAALRGGDAARVSPLWLGGCYVLLSIGELLLSPMGLALVTQLAPPRLATRFIGLWFASVTIGHGLAAALGLLWSRWPHHRYFALVAAVTLLAAAVLLLRLRALETAMAPSRY